MRTRPLSQELLDQALAFERERKPPVEPIDAATIALIRDSPEGIEVYLLRRHSQMPFASGMYVFPGGRVDPRDSDVDIGWTGPSAEEWAEVLDCDSALARALVCAAVRETFEESGVLLAGETPHTVVGSTTDPDWEIDRRALVAREFSMAQLVARRRLVVRSDLMNPWAHWITPRFEPRRYDTRFFVSVMPSSQHARDVSGEADHVLWLSAAEACRRVDAGDMEMLPPTYTVCEQLGALATTEAVMATRPTVYAIEPRPDFMNGEPVFVIDEPDDVPEPRA